MPKNKATSDMYVVEVIPITRAIGKETLTYFTSKKIAAGALVEVNIRSKNKQAIVVSSKPARESKISLRSSSYPVKKINSVVSKSFLLPGFIEAARESAEYFAGSTGSVLNILGSIAIKNISAKIKNEEDKEYEVEKETKIKPEVALLQADEKERISIYKNIIREEFARGFSVFFCLPEISEIERLSGILKKGIEDYTFIFHSGTPKKELGEMWQKAANKQHPVCIIGTAAFLSIPRSDLGTIILDKESARGYKTYTRPFLDIRKFSQIYAAKISARLIFGDIVLRPETIYKKEKGEYSELSPLKFRSLSDASNEILDMKKDENESNIKKEVKIISDKIKKTIILNKKQSERMFILTARRGLYPFTICNDCGNIIKCGKCNTSAVLHKKGSENIFMCHMCGSFKKASDRCPSCGSWRLATLGIGIEHIEELLKKESPEVKIFRIDKDKVKTHKKALEIRDSFYKTPGSVLIGTEMAIPYIHEDIENVAVISIDSLFTIPDFRIHERIFNILARIRAKALKRFILQTRDPENKIFKYSIMGNIMDFYKDEVSARKCLGYPPFTTLIKITLIGGKSTVEKEIEKLANKLSEYEPLVFPSFISTVKGKYKINILIKLPEDKWVDERLLEELRALPMSFEVRVDPNDML